MRLLHIARALSAEYKLTLLCFSEHASDEFPEGASEEERRLFADVHVVRLPRWQSYLQTLLAIPTRTPLQLAYYRSRRFKQILRKLLPEHDGVVAHLQRTGQYVDALGATKPVLLDMTDAFSLVYQRGRQLEKSAWLHLVHALEQKRLARIERAAPTRFSETWLVSPVDVEHLFGKTMPGTVACAPVPVDLAEYPYQAHVAGNTVLFIGAMAYAPNRDACFWFCSEILPGLRDRIPNLRFRIVGPADRATRAQLNAIAGVEALGGVQHIREHLQDVFCGVCPVRAGAGMQNKVLNYLALGLPCVSTEVGMEGIRAAQGREMLCFKTAAEAIEQIAMLAARPDLRDQLRARGLSAAKAYSTEEVYPFMRARARALFGQEVPSQARSEPDPWAYAGASRGAVRLNGSREIYSTLP